MTSRNDPQINNLRVPWLRLCVTMCLGWKARISKAVSVAPHSSRGPRAGVLLPELIISLTLLGTATAVMMALLLSVATQRRAAEQRQAALLQAENLLDDFLAVPWPQTTQSEFTRRLAAIDTDTTSAPLRLPDLERAVAVAERPDDAARQITVELHWRNHAGHVTAPVRLSAWKFAPAEEQP